MSAVPAFFAWNHKELGCLTQVVCHHDSVVVNFEEKLLTVTGDVEWTICICEREILGSILKHTIDLEILC